MVQAGEAWAQRAAGEGPGEAVGVGAIEVLVRSGGLTVLDSETRHLFMLRFSGFVLLLQLLWKWLISLRDHRESASFGFLSSL